MRARRDAAAAEHDWANASDAELLDACRSGETAAFSFVWQRHRRAGLAAAAGIAPGLDADDVVSDAYLKVFELVLDGRGPSGAFRPYLYRVIRSVAVDRLRSPEQASEWLDQIPDLTEAGPWEDNVFDLNATVEAFSSLNERWQSVLWYTEVEGMPPREVALILGISANSVSALAVRAREALRSAWVEAHVSRELADAECRVTLERLQRYQRGKLTARASREVAAHLDGCAPCSAAAAEFGTLNRQLALALAVVVLGGGTATALAGGLGLTTGAGGAAAAASFSAGGAASGAAGGAGAAGTAAGAGAVGAGAAAGAAVGGSLLLTVSASVAAVALAGGSLFLTAEMFTDAPRPAEAAQTNEAGGRDAVRADARSDRSLSRGAPGRQGGEPGVSTEAEAEAEASVDVAIDGDVPGRRGEAPKPVSPAPGAQDPAPEGPKAAEPGETDPGNPDPGETDPGETDPGETDPGETDPGETDPGETDPGETDPGGTDPDPGDGGDDDETVDPSLSPGFACAVIGTDPIAVRLVGVATHRGSVEARVVHPDGSASVELGSVARTSWLPLWATGSLAGWGIDPFASTLELRLVGDDGRTSAWQPVDLGTACIT